MAVSQPHVSSAHASADVRRSFDDVFAEYAGFVARALAHFGVARSDVEDVCQEVFVVVHDKLADLENHDRLRTWVYGIAWRTAANHRRRAQRRAREPLLEEPATPASQERRVELSRAADRLAEILRALDDDKRAVFVLYEIEELSMREVVEVLGCPLQTGYSRLRAARELVQRTWKGGHR